MYTLEALPGGIVKYYIIEVDNKLYRTTYDQVFEAYSNSKICILDWTIVDLYNYFSYIVERLIK